MRQRYPMVRTLIKRPRVSGAAVFTLVLNANGSYSFTLEGPIDHAASADELLVNLRWWRPTLMVIAPALPCL
ncbi:exported hypothetical protein [Vibrio aestuarianus]|nr:exported hypothetical protein [Vibrio aestuarianus]